MIYKGFGFKCEKCGNTAYESHAQQMVRDPVTGESRWSTRRERLENPSLQPDRESYVWVDDPTWHTCSGCGVDVDAAKFPPPFDANRIAQGNRVPDWKISIPPVREDVGMIVFDDRALKEISF